MVDKIKKAKSRYEDDEKHSRRHDDDDDEDYDGGSNGSKYEKLYGVIDALVDQIEMPKNRTRAIKFGIRALGELLSETNVGNSRGGGSHCGRSGGSSERGVSKR